MSKGRPKGKEICKMRICQDGVPVYVLPDCAACLADENRRSPLNLDECPMGKDICDVCEYYSEEW